MIDPTGADVGRKVVYTGNRYPGGKLEDGVITSFNSYAVFVRYGSDYGSKGTDRADLEWAHDTAPSTACSGSAEKISEVNRKDGRVV